MAGVKLPKKDLATAHVVITDLQKTTLHEVADILVKRNSEVFGEALRCYIRSIDKSQMTNPVRSRLIVLGNKLSE